MVHDTVALEDSQERQTMKRMTNKELQKFSERFALNILTDELKTPHDSIMDIEHVGTGTL